MGSKKSRNRDKKKRIIVPAFEVRHEIIKKKSRAGVEYVGRVNLFGFLEGFHQTIIGWTELRFVEIIIDSLAGDRIAKADLKMLGVVNEAFASRIVEGGWSTLLLQLGKTEVAHRSATLQGHVRISLPKDLRPLTLDHFILA